jgi:MATE family multidrug resistance protein
MPLLESAATDKDVLAYQDSAAVISVEEEDAQPLLTSSTPSVWPVSGSTRQLQRVVSSATLLWEKSLAKDKGYLHEVGRLLALTIPLVATNTSSFLISTISIVFVGHIGKFELSVAVLAASIFNVTGLSFLLGSLGALETLCSQAYGAKNYPAVGIVLQRSLLFTTTLAVLVATMWSQAEMFLLFLGQDPAISAAAARYLHWSIPALFFVGSGDCLKRYLTAQNCVAPATVSSIIAMVVAPLINWLLIVKRSEGLYGAAMAANIAQGVPFIVMVLWTMHREASMKAAASSEQTWHGWSKEALRGWGEYLRLAGPSAAMVCLEWSTFEACVILAGWLGDPEQNVAVMGLVLNISGLLYMLPQGLGSATSVRVGNALGAGLPRAAKRAAYVAFGMVLVTQVVLATATLACRNTAAYFFTDDKDVASAAAKIFPIMAWCLLGDGVNSTVAGVLRGAGRQELGAMFNLVAYWVLGLPLAGFLAFKMNLGVIGLWIGLATCASFNGVAMTIAMVRLKWKVEALRATGKAALAQDCDDMDSEDDDDDDEERRHSRSSSTSIGHGYIQQHHLHATGRPRAVEFTESAHSKNTSRRNLFDDP